MRQPQFTVIAGTADKIIVHKFDGCRIQSRLDKLRHQRRRLGKIGKHGENIQLIRTERHKFQRRFRNDSQRSFRADNQLIETKTGGTLLQRRSQIGNFTVR